MAGDVSPVAMFVVNSVLWRFTLFLRNSFWRNLRAFVWRKIESKIGYVEKKLQISGMILTKIYSN